MPGVQTCSLPISPLRSTRHSSGCTARRRKPEKRVPMKLILSIEHVRFPLTGIGRYTYELARHLQARTEINELRFFARRCFVDHVPTAAEQSGHGHRKKKREQKSYAATERAEERRVGNKCVRTC